MNSYLNGDIISDFSENHLKYKIGMKILIEKKRLKTIIHYSNTRIIQLPWTFSESLKTIWDIENSVWRPHHFSLDIIGFNESFTKFPDSIRYTGKNPITTNAASMNYLELKFHQFSRFSTSFINFNSDHNLLEESRSAKLRSRKTGFVSL